MPVPYTFDREKHVYRNSEFSELLKDAVRFFNGTPVFPLPPPESFTGAGVYAIYCISRTGIYKKFGTELNRTSYAIPIYAGKAVPSGWRQSRDLSADSSSGTELYHRLQQHASSIQAARNLDLADFMCRFAIFEDGTESMIAAVEAELISSSNPLWNSVIDGFGNHDPGAKRITGKVPQWDVLHPGRSWAQRMTGPRAPVSALHQRVKDYLVGVRP